MQLDFPSVFVKRGEIVFSHGNYLGLPTEYLKPKSKQILGDYFLELLGGEAKKEVVIGVDPLGFNYVTYDFLCYVGLVIEAEAEKKAQYNKFRKKYPDHKFNKEYIKKRIIAEYKLLNYQEYVPVDIVTQNLHELRGLNGKISAHIDELMKINDESLWEEKFDLSPENYKKIYVASRFIKFILDNTKFYIPNFFENLIIKQDGKFVAHRSISKIIKIYRNDFKLDKATIAFEGTSFQELKGEKEYFEILIKILIENALKFSIEPERLNPKVTVRQNNKHLIIEVHSYGYLIPIIERKHLFTKGFRSETTKKMKEGTGFGLYNSKQLVEKFNGTIEYSPKAISKIGEEEIGWNIFVLTFSI